ncbi:probable WRKY transcription factor 75 [Rutidosis leptorrhynchoides]|uniref:probable WRKY transcription factor 75 n=1 Tax=Rutidosis leptorrhynchoides TaxID=125765 RepID=UPI003A99992A
MNNNNNIFSYNSSSSSSYLTLNMMHNNNHATYEDTRLLSNQDAQTYKNSDDIVVADHSSLAHDDDRNEMSNMRSSGKSSSINIQKGEKKIRKPKHAFQTRSQVDILDDGYKWRKYGQKAVKNNKFPRNYYRCTHEGCNVKKQVQRLSNDDGVVVTTYEGVHSHPIQKSTDNFETILTQMQIISR